jgi:hypothetical protein
MKSNNSFKESLKIMLNKYHGIIAFLIFILGVVIRIFASGSQDKIWQIVGDIGTFLAGAVAIPFIYDRLIKSEDKKIFISDLEDVIIKHNLGNTYRNTPYIYEHGRMPIHEKVTFFQDAKSDIYEVGIALNTFASFFDQRPLHDYKKPVMDLLRNGVKFTCLVLDPDSQIANLYSIDTGEKNLVQKISSSIEKLNNLKNEFKKLELKGDFNIYKYNHIPHCYILLVDPEEINGRAYVSHYIFSSKRADTPILEIHKSSNPVIFEKYFTMVKNLLAQSQET